MQDTVPATQADWQSLLAHVLIVEDNVLIALDAEHLIAELGAASTRIAKSLDEAASAIAERRPSFAILDIDLGDSDCFPVADALNALGVAFVFATGHAEHEIVPDRFANAPRLAKPYLQRELADALCAIAAVS